jgi:hypothetical protein
MRLKYSRYAILEISKNLLKDITSFAEEILSFCKRIILPPTPRLTLLGLVSSRKALLRAKTSMGGPVVTSANLEDMVNVVPKIS